MLFAGVATHFVSSELVISSPFEQLAFRINLSQDFLTKYAMQLQGGLAGSGGIVPSIQYGVRVSI